MEHMVFQNCPVILVFVITYFTILFHPEARICSFFIPYVYFACGFFCTLFLCHKPDSYMLPTQFFIMDVFYHLLMSMHGVLVKSVFFFAEVIATTFTLENRNHFFFPLFIIFLHIMISSGLDLMSFTLNFQSGVFPNYNIFAISSSSIIAFNQVIIFTFSYPAFLNSGF